ncbi:hypothetical protein BEN47_00820 [Hymenobacter lapidarius]|uniref:Glycosyltransferase RgtA/B/C/D-like domain-containing protein n=1 Tax=Hymenobacter lapidarius TaxID=1908237 RepID=A0A1G1TA37_9BACT|nr:hypothetical protein BEN47_00820 [Hymenobacter lapidarius]
MAVVALYALYLPLSGYAVGDFGFDAAEYWELSLKFTQQGGFSLLGYDDPVRGYLGPLLILPARVLCHFTGWSMLAGAQVLGAAWAALLMGIAIPALVAQVTGRALAAGRWLALLGLMFVFWRDYFNFTLSDMPALTLLVLALVALRRSQWMWAVAAGVFLAAAINIRPIYIASLPGCLWLFFRNAPPGRRGIARAGLLVVGAALLLLPQWRINRHHFQRNTPLVMAGAPQTRPLYLKQLTWGTAFQRYETSLIPEIPRSLVYADPAGQLVLARQPAGRFASYGAYLKFAALHPVATGMRYLRHLFNGLDIRFPTPYPRHLHPPGQETLRLLNYALLGLGTWLALAAWWRSRQSQQARGVWRAPVAPVLLALLLPCLLVLPTLIECRFLLPLHMLLLAAIATCWHPRTWWRKLGGPARRVAFLVLATGWLWGCWQLSEDTARHLRPSREAPQE